MIEGDADYEATFAALVLGRAEEARQEHEELTAHGFRVVQVVGSPSLLYERGGKVFTRLYALAHARAIRPDERGEGG